MHDVFMKRCLELAAQGQGATGINPLVGSLLVREGNIVSESYHSGYGNSHSERQLLEKYEQKISTKNYVYVNLEPCSHTGKTPPCIDIILERGIKNVVFGMKDPNPNVNGKGIDALQSSGVNVIGPVLPELCTRLNRGFVSLQEQQRPWITLKKAQTPSGAIANNDKSSLSITSVAQNEWSHQYLRATHDAILVGVETIVRDNPQLTTRVQGKNLPSPMRIIFDPHARIPMDASVISSEFVSGTIVIVEKGTDCFHLKEKGVMTMEVPLKDGFFDWSVLWLKLTTPQDSFIGIKSILVEGGQHTWQLFQSAGMIDEEVILVGSV